MGSTLLAGVTVLFWSAVISMTILCIVVIYCYNKIISNKNSVIRSWSDVIIYERQKNNVLPEIEVAVAGYKEYEHDLQIKITQLRSALNQINENELNNKSLKKAEEHTRSLVDGVKIALENYPGLKASNLVQNFIKEIARQQENIAASITIFNKNVELFNNGIQTFPGYMVNNYLNKLVTIEPFVDQKAVDAFEYKLKL